jgi:hypothetical protein
MTAEDLRLLDIFFADRVSFARTVDPEVLQSNETLAFAWPQLQKRWGQAMPLLRQLGIAPPPTDLIFYYREIMVK